MAVHKVANSAVLKIRHINKIGQGLGYVVANHQILSPRSLKKERQLLVEARKFFRASRLARIRSEDLQAYREHRAKRGTGSAYINMEMGVIRRILKRAKRWHLVGEDLKPLKERRQVGRVLSHEEKTWLLRMAANRPDWQIARCAMILARNTTMRGGELKGLRWRDISLLNQMLVVSRSKTEAGERVIPLNDDAMAAVLELYKRAQLFAGTELNHYVFPACENGKIDPRRAQGTWRTAWRHLTRAIHCPACAQLQKPAAIGCNNECKADIREVTSPTAGLRFHDLRHHAITELAESRASEQTILSIAGHGTSPQRCSLTILTCGLTQSAAPLMPSLAGLPRRDVYLRRQIMTQITTQTLPPS